MTAILTKIKTALIGGFFMLVLCASAFADVTLLVGASQFTPHGDGVWYQKAFPYELNMRSASVGLRYDAKRYGDWGYSAGYMYLGRVSSSAIATGVDGDYNEPNGYNTRTQSCNGGNCGYLSHWYGQGDVQGLFGSTVRHFGPWAVEAGLYLYRPTWQMHIPDWVGHIRDAVPIDLTVTHNPKLQLGPMVGIRYTVDQWSLNFSAWQTASYGDEWSSLYHRITYNASLGYTF